MRKIGTKAYLKTLIKDPLVSSITPTSIFGIKKLCENINFAEANLIVEYGPGGGIITKYLLSKMKSDSILVAIENNESFCDALKFIDDERLILFHNSAENVNALLKDLYSKNKTPSVQADHIISGIPFSMFPSTLKNAILNATTISLKSEGSFIVYQFLISLSYGKKDIKRKIREYFHVFRSEVEIRNVPPLRIYECSLKDAEQINSKNLNNLQ